MDNNLKLLEILSSVLEIEKNEINDATSPENTETWDSFNALVLASELEDGFNVSFTIEEVEPRLFSFNSPYGACEECEGIGHNLNIDPNLTSRLTIFSLFFK